MHDYDIAEIIIPVQMIEMIGIMERSSRCQFPAAEL